MLLPQPEQQPQPEPMPLTQTTANNNTVQILPDVIIKHNAESTMLLSITTTTTGFSLPEMPNDERRFPLRQLQRTRWCHMPQQQQQQLHQQHEQIRVLVAGKFPLQQKYRGQRFPLQQQHATVAVAVAVAPTNNNSPVQALRFPQRMIQLPLAHRFPVTCQLAKRNFSYTIQAIAACGCSTPVAMSGNNVAARMLKEFPTIKKQFVKFPNNQQTCKNPTSANGQGNANANAGHGNCQKSGAAILRTAATPTPTMTQTSHNMSTKIDMDSQQIVIDDNDVDVVDDVLHKALLDNELDADEQTLNLNVEAEGVGERKEIEHQQAENFNDASGRRHSEGEGEGDDGDGDGDDAMNANSAKNKREICEQSKLETTSAAASGHNELNMTKERRQSICLASEQRQTIAEPTASNCQRHSDARESSSEQVDGQQQQQISYCHHVKSNEPTHVTQTDTELAPSSSSSSPSPRPSIEFFKSALRALLDEGTTCAPLIDLDLVDLLSELVKLIATPTNTGNFWSENEREPVADLGASECADMTVSKVCEDSSEASVAAVDCYSEPIEQPLQLDDNNNNSNNYSSSSNQSGDMKYEVLKSTARLPEARPSRLSSSTTAAAAAAVTAATAATGAPITAVSTGRIRDVTVPTTSMARPLLGDLKRSSSSRDDISIDVDSLLPERTRLRRQRRMRSQESVEEKPEDVIERLNKLKARISGALSEVKGVLKQYSTESEAETAGEKRQEPEPVSVSASPPVTAPEAAEPVKFRFLKKVRRRSIFDEAEEEKEQAKEAAAEAAVIDAMIRVGKKQLEIKEEPAAEATTKVIEELQTETVQTNKANKEEEQPKEAQQTPRYNGELKSKAMEKDKTQSKIEFLAKVQSELKSKPKSKEPTAAIKEQPEVPVPASSKQLQPVEAVEATPQAAALPNESATQPANLDTKTTSPKAAPLATKKKIIVKVKNPRRASIAAVEPSKIVAEPVQIDALTQRRPSDSETIVKRKKKLKLTSSVATTTTSGSNQKAPAAPQEQQATATATTTATTTATATATNEQVVAAKVIDNAAIAKSVTKPTAKSIEVDEKKAEAAAAATRPTTEVAATTTTTTTTTAAETTATKPAAATVQTAPKQLATVGTANQATASGQGRRASLKLTELVGETVLVVPATRAATAATINTQDNKSARSLAEADPATLSAAISSSLSESKEPINQSTSISATAGAPQAEGTPQQVAVAADIEVAVAVVVAVTDASAPQIAATLSEFSHDQSSPQQQEQQQQQEQLVKDTKDKAQAQPSDSLVAMPELKVLTGPVQPVKIETVEQPHDESDLVAVKKKSSHLKKLVRKSSIDKGKEKLNESAKLSNILKDNNKITDLTDRINKLTPPKKQSKATTKEQAAITVPEKQHENAENAAEITSETGLEPELEPIEQPDVAPTPAPKKPRQIKKKVIIKRQKRRLSIGDTFFIQQEPEEPKEPEIETIEKAIAYVTDDEEDVEPVPEPEPAKPLKSCLHVREYKIGDLVLYAERYRKTQVRWKRGRVLERITSISYKLDIEGKEVPAHISYIKKYTGRKVKFVGKEYLEIDYEQVVEEERRARSYSIWNMV